jgi:NAD(P)-dependent dehydrogenase (short-subunit alcohol dehydrogenase family)
VPSVLITGASTGIGQACALHMAEKGWDVWAGVRRPESAPEHARVKPLRLDVTDAASIAEAAAELGDAPLGGLVNNAGVAVAGPVEFLDLEELRRQLEVNLVGQVAVTQAFLPAIRRGGGRVVFIGSIGGRTHPPYMSPYGASKAAIAAVADALRRELRDWGLHVSLVEPGTIATPIWDKGESDAEETLRALPERGRELYGEKLQRIAKIAIGMGRHGKPPSAVAEVVEHALTASRPKTRYLVGDAKIQAPLLGLLPDRVGDALIARRLG